MKHSNLVKFALTPIAYCLLQTTTHASSAVGTDNHLGNELNPTGLSVLCKPAPNGLTPFNKASRNPTGRLYQQPCISPELDTEGEGWIVFGNVEGGVIGSGGDDDNAYFVEYADRGTEPTITVLSVNAFDKESAQYSHINLGNVGRDDMHASATYGEAGSYQISLTYNKTPHTYATTAKSPYLGIGTDYLKLPDAIPVNSVLVGGEQELNDYIGGTDAFDLKVDRERFGINVNYEIMQGVNAFIDYKYEKRDGVKAYGGSFNFDYLGFAGAVNEVLQPIDYNSNDITAGIYYRGDNLNLNFSYVGSFFRNDIDSVTYENPWNTGSNYQAQVGQTDLYPENDFNQLRLEGNYKLPVWKGLVTLSLSQGKMEQDDDLLPYTANTGLINFSNGAAPFDMANWNTTDSLERSSGKGEMDTNLVQLKVSLKPTKKLGLKLGFRNYEEDDTTPEFATCNGQADNDQCVFMFLDGSIAGSYWRPDLVRLFDPANSIYTNFHYLSIPFDKEKENVTLSASYQVLVKTKVSVDYDRETINRDHREVDETQEDKYRLNVVHRDADWGTLRVELGYNQRDFDGDYNSNPYGPFYTEHLLHDYIEDTSTSQADKDAAQAAFDGLAPHTLNNLRKSDLSGRDQTNIATKLNLAVGELTDLMLTADYKENDYDADYGLKDDETTNYGLELAHMYSEKTNVFISYHYQAVKSSMANIDSTEAGTDGDAGGSYYPLENVWGSSEDETNHFVTLGLITELFDRYRFSFNYSYAKSETDISYNGSTAALTGTLKAIDANPVGSYDTLRYEQQSIQANLRGELSPQLSWRLMLQYEIGKIDDFYYDGIQYADNRKMLLGNSIDDWDAYTYGVLMQYQF